MRIGLRVVAVASVLAASVAGAQRPHTQLGLGLDWLRQTGSLPDSVDRRKGLAIRIQATVPWKRYVGFRVEGDYVQVQYKRAGDNGSIGISETNIALGGYLRAFIPRGESMHPYALAGSIISVRASCDLDNAFASTGFVRCQQGEDFLIGWGAGAGVQFGNWLGVKWFTEMRIMGKSTAASGGNLLALSFGAGM